MNRALALPAPTQATIALQRPGVAVVGTTQVHETGVPTAFFAASERLEPAGGLSVGRHVAGPAVTVAEIRTLFPAVTVVGATRTRTAFVAAAASWKVTTNVHVNASAATQQGAWDRA